MSKIGKQPIKIPEEVKVNIGNGIVSISGPKGELKQLIRSEIKVVKKDNVLKVSIAKKRKQSKALHGVTRSLLANMVKGVTEGYQKKLELKGVGYRVTPQGKGLKLTVGFSHPVVIDEIKGIEFDIEGKNIIKVSGIDKQKVGQVAADIRAVRPPEPYKGKGIRYQGETIKLKPGKAAKVGAMEE